VDVPPVNPNSKDQDVRLLDAARSGELSSVRTLLREGLNIDAADGDGVTPLIFAAMAGHVDVVSELLAAGANRLHTDGMGYDAIRAAMLFGDFRGTTQPPHDEILRLLDPSV
jgi:ankyrin repeat protein